MYYLRRAVVLSKTSSGGSAVYGLGLPYHLGRRAYSMMLVRVVHACFFPTHIVPKHSLHSYGPDDVAIP